MSQQDLANIASVTRQTISGVERNERHPKGESENQTGTDKVRVRRFPCFDPYIESSLRISAEMIQTVLQS